MLKIFVAEPVAGNGGNGQFHFFLFRFRLPGSGRSRQVQAGHAQAGSPEKIASRYVLVHTGGGLWSR
jgi:hypothetical protein